MPETRERWHIGREVPITLILAIAAQTLGLVWWARGEVAARERLEQRQAEYAARLVALESQRVSERLSSVESQLVDAKDLLRRIDDRTQRLVERQRQEPVR